MQSYLHFFKFMVNPRTGLKSLKSLANERADPHPRHHIQYPITKDGYGDQHLVLERRSLWRVADLWGLCQPWVCCFWSNQWSLKSYSAEYRKICLFKGISGDLETVLLLKALLTKTDVFDTSGIHDQRSFTLSAWPRLNLRLWTMLTHHTHRMHRWPISLARDQLYMN